MYFPKKTPSSDRYLRKGEKSMSFVGSFKHSLDAKKRVFIPAKFREELGDEFYITRKFDTYLSIYTAEDWEVYVDKIQQLPETVALEVQEFLLGIAQKCVPDSNGRIILDVKGEEKKQLTIDALLRLFEASSGSQFTSDKVMLTK